MQYPTDWKAEYSKKPICGVLAIAMVAGITFDEATEAVKRHLMPHQKRHGGKTYDEQRKNALKELGVTFVECYVEKMTLQRWISMYAMPDRTYKITTSKHVVTVRNGLVCDQYEIAPIEVHNSRRCFVREALAIF